jgi:propionyl-CoA synthetase
MANVLGDLGVTKGDRVIIYMPMILEAAYAMLACARIGAIHSVVFGGFAAHNLAIRMDDAEAKMVITVDAGLRGGKVINYKNLVNQGVEQATVKPEHVLVVDRGILPFKPQALDVDYATERRISCEANAIVDPVWLESNTPSYLLYTSGTTGTPKGVQRDTGGHAVALADSMRTVYGVEPGDVFWAASDVGWVVGHSYIVYAPLLAGCTAVLYEGKPVRTPDAGAFWRVIAEHRVRAFFVAPTAFRAIRKEDPEGALLADHDISCLERLYLAGERCDPPTLRWLEQLVRIPVIDHWWQTETGWPVCAIPAGIESMPTRAGSAGVPMPGHDLRVLDDDGRQVADGDEGHLVLKLPLPPGTLQSVWNDPDRFHDSYLKRFPGYYHTGDGGFRDTDGYVFVMGRTDDVINVAGHRLSTGEIEEVVAAHPAVAECAVFGMHDADRGEVPVGLMLIQDGSNIDARELEQEVVAMVRRDIGAFANFRRALVVPRLPKTRSGKILRQALRGIAAGREVAPPSTIDDPAILEEIAEVLRSGGLTGG